MALILGPASLPWRGTRGTDKYGSGVFGADRDGGSRQHLGRDYIALPGDPGISPIKGKVTHIGKAYPDSDLDSIRIAGCGIEVRILYIKPSVAVGQTVEMGETIGDVQDVSSRYPGITGHVHVEVWKPIDPMLVIKGGA